MGHRPPPPVPGRLLPPPAFGGVNEPLKRRDEVKALESWHAWYDIAIEDGADADLAVRVADGEVERRGRGVYVDLRPPPPPPLPRHRDPGIREIR